MSVPVSFVIPSPCNLLQRCSLAINNHMITSQASHWLGPPTIYFSSSLLPAKFYGINPRPLKKRRQKRFFVSVHLSASVKRFSVSQMRDVIFFLFSSTFCIYFFLSGIQFCIQGESSFLPPLKR